MKKENIENGDTKEVFLLSQLDRDIDHSELISPHTGVAQDKGGRPSQQDYYMTSKFFDPLESKNCEFFCICDAFGKDSWVGKLVTDKVMGEISKGFEHYLLEWANIDTGVFKGARLTTPWEDLLTLSFYNLQHAINSDPRFNTGENGCTATLAVYERNSRNLIMASIGDSPLYLVSQNSIKNLAPLDVATTWPNQLTKALLGFAEIDHLQKKAYLPKVQRFILSRQIRGMIIGSDGIMSQRQTQVMHQQNQVIDQFSQQSPEVTAKQIVRLATSYIEADNATAIVIKV